METGRFARVKAYVDAHGGFAHTIDASLFNLISPPQTRQEVIAERERNKQSMLNLCTLMRNRFHSGLEKLRR